MSKPILMGSENHSGVKLENLFSKLIKEILQKSAKISQDQREEARIVLSNNLEIIQKLIDARDIQINSYELLDELSTNEGPAGNARIGGIFSSDATYDL